MEKEVVSYIQEARNHGLSDLEIKKNLLDAGWEAGVVEESFSHVKALDNKQSPPAPQPQAPAAVQEQTRPEQAAPSFSHAPVVQEAAKAAESPAPVVLSEKHFTQPASSGHKGLWTTLGVVLGVLVIGAASYLYYAFAYNNPTKIWTSFVKGESSKIYENSFKFSYQDNGSLTKDDNKALGFELKNMKLGFNGDFYVDNSDSSNPQASSTAQFTFSSGNTSFSTGAQYRLINKSLYINIGENPYMDMVFNSLSNGKRYDWIKIDLEELDKQAASSTDSQDVQYFKDVFTNDFVDELKKVWDDTTFVKVDKYVGKETVNGVSTLHFKNTLDKEAIKQLGNAYVDKIVGRMAEQENKNRATPLSSDEIDQVKNPAKTAIEEVVNKLQVSEFDTWIGVKDFRLYQVHIVSNAPSLISAIKVGQQEYDTTTNPDDSDSTRLSDMRKLASALEEYYKDTGRYPETKDGIPQGLVPNYINSIPVAPEPPSGSCTSYYNTYWYEVKDTLPVYSGSSQNGVAPSMPVRPQPGSSYEYTFCLGHATGGYPAGIAKLSPLGIEANIACPGKQEDCVNASASDSTEKTTEDRVREFIGKIDFNGEFRIDADYRNYGQVKDLEKPGEYFDLLDAIKKQMQKYQQYDASPMLNESGAAPMFYRDTLKMGYLLGQYIK